MCVIVIVHESILERDHIKVPLPFVHHPDQLCLHRGYLHDDLLLLSIAKL